jgi:hypothetical protein
MTDSSSDDDYDSSSSEEPTPPSIGSIPNLNRTTSPTATTPLVENLARLALSETMSVRGEPSTPRGGSRADTPSTGRASDGIKLAQPDLFYGDRKHYEAFLTQLHLNLIGNRNNYPNEESKVIYAGSFLRGSALAWFKPLLEDRVHHGDQASATTKNVFTWEGFVGELGKMYGDVDERRTAERKLETLRQKKTVAQYAAIFQQYTPRIGWNNEALLAQFRLGLKSEIKDMLINQPSLPTDLDDYIRLCIHLDQRVIERRWEKGERASVPSANTAKKRHGASRKDPDEMDWEFSATKGRPNGGARSSRGPLTPAQRKERMDKNLCLYCGKPGHKAKECRANKSAAATQHTFAATSAPLHLGRLVRFSEPPRANEGRRRRRPDATRDQERYPTPAPKPRQRFTVTASEEGRAVSILTKYYVNVWCSDPDCQESAQHTHEHYNCMLDMPRTNTILLRVTDQRRIADMYREARGWFDMNNPHDYRQWRMIWKAMTADTVCEYLDEDTEGSPFGSEADEPESGNGKAART